MSEKQSDTRYGTREIRSAFIRVLQKTPVLNMLDDYAQTLLASRVRDSVQSSLSEEHRYFTNLANIQAGVYVALRDTPLFCVMTKEHLEQLAGRITEEVKKEGKTYTEIEAAEGTK